MEEDRRDPAQQPALGHLRHVLEQPLHGHAELRRRRHVRLGDDRLVPLGRANHRHVEVVVGLLAELARLLGGSGRGQLGRGALHLEVHADLEQLERRKLPDRLGALEVLEHVERALQAQTRLLLDGDREPQVELVIAQVVVGHPGMLVDHLRRAVGMLGIHLGGHQHRGVAEGPRVVDRGDLADDPVVQQRPHPPHDLLLAEAGLASDRGVGPGLEREAALHEVEHPLVGLVERHGRAVLARADLGRSYPSCSHCAASLAW